MNNHKPYKRSKSPMNSVSLVVGALMIVAFQALAQNSNGYDGIVVESSPTNITSVYYGEPVFLFFKFKNTKDAPNYYYGPITYINLRFTLTDIRSGKKMPQHQINIDNGGDISAFYQKEKPDDPYKPRETGFYSVLLNEYFDSERLTNEKTKTNSLTTKLGAIPVGKYEFALEYTLMPGKNVILAIHKFEVLPIPPNEKNAFDAYVSATLYGAKVFDIVNGHYSAANPDSFENFIKKYPSSVFTNHAFLNMVIDIYKYAKAGPPEQARIEKFNQFLNGYSSLRNSNLKMVYVTYLPAIIKLIPGKDLKTELDSFLKNIKDDHPDISDKLVRQATVRYRVTGLKSYAAPY